MNELRAQATAAADQEEARILAQCSYAWTEREKDAFILGWCSGHLKGFEKARDMALEVMDRGK